MLDLNTVSNRNPELILNPDPGLAEVAKWVWAKRCRYKKATVLVHPHQSKKVKANPLTQHEGPGPPRSCGCCHRKYLIVEATDLSERRFLQAAPNKPYRDLSKFQDRRVLYPSLSRKPLTPAPTLPEGRIVGGQEAVPNSWPHQVALFIDDAYFCGGSLISESPWTETCT